MGKYANNTTVSPEKSQAEIQNTLRKYGADRFGTMEEKTKAHVMFSYSGLSIQISIDLPEKSSFVRTKAGHSRPKDAIDASYNQAIRQRWRALLLAIKAKLEAIECGISTIEEEFMAFIIMPDGMPLSSHILPKLQTMVKTGKMPKLLSYGGNE